MNHVVMNLQVMYIDGRFITTFFIKCYIYNTRVLSFLVFPILHNRRMWDRCTKQGVPLNWFQLYNVSIATDNATKGKPWA